MISLTSPVRTRAHDAPAGAKLALLAGATVVLAATDALSFHIAALGGTLLLYALPGRVFFKAGVSRLRILWPFVAIVLLWHVVLRDTEAGLVIALRMVTAVGLANLVTMTTRLTDIMAVLRWLGTPFARLGLNMNAVEIGIGLLIRMVPVLREKGDRLTESWRARARRRAGWRLVLPLTVLALDDADKVSEALRARGGLSGNEKE
ncbi:energy-coupling factor transporter transmembrane component T family protein [Rhodalgimonas zhirmunskyi]|uniref:Energy-coupling factor transporter transmembrane protein EcfT n=1 Tax=Rhodalgimonas zhirmunskyi TaxID=2964767 RepID=A0AAJ1X504_9RHOB|nr:energy-coupling factor transporter transmembrane protein EcfT [Rhodoalgimonas zhirmunskyi]MDQ2093069.1 energy-coupling factor transporter transmembrane protein EcfT [Rhodoalgimonas zhirmunskyi]